MDMPLRSDNILAFDAPSRVNVANAANAESDRLPGEEPNFECIHFFADDPDALHVRALREYGCLVTTHPLDADVSVLAGADHAAIVMDVTHLSRSFGFCRQLRARGIDFPFVTLTQAADPFDEVLALELGTDEVIGRQIHPRVLLAQLYAISRRSKRTIVSAPTSMLRFGELQIDGENREVVLQSRRIPVTSGEFNLLWLLAQNAGQVIHRDEVLKRLRGLAGAHGNRSIDARLYRLRQRFQSVPDIAARIKTVRPYGYLFVNAAW